MKTQVLSAFDRDDVSGLSVKLSGAEYMLSIQGGTRDDAASSHTNDALDEVHAPASPSLSKATLDPLRLGALVTSVRLCALFLCTQESERERQRERGERESVCVCVRERTYLHARAHSHHGRRTRAGLAACTRMHRRQQRVAAVGHLGLWRACVAVIRLRLLCAIAATCPIHRQRCGELASTLARRHAQHARAGPWARRRAEGEAVCCSRTQVMRRCER